MVVADDAFDDDENEDIEYIETQEEIEARKEKARKLIEAMLKNVSKKDLAEYILKRRTIKKVDLLNEENKARYRLDPVAYCVEIHGARLTPDQVTIMNMVRDNKFVIVQASHGVGKCVASSEYLTLADGKRVQAADLVDSKFRLLTLNSVGEVVPVDAYAEWNAVEPVYAITTEGGRKIVRNAAHPLWVGDLESHSGMHPKITDTKWRAIDSIKVGDVVAVTRVLNNLELHAQNITDTELKTLAYLIGDGGYTRNGVVFTQQDNLQLAEFQECAKELNCKLTKSNTRPYDYRVTSALPSSKGKKGSNPIMELLRKYKLMGKHSRDKRIPAIVFELNNERLALFLSRLFSTDGWASLNQGGGMEVGFCSVSEGLVRDVQELLLRFGIAGNIRYRPPVNAWDLSLRSANQIKLFSEQIGIYGKEVAINKVYEKALTKQESDKWRYKDCPAGTKWERVKSIEFVGIEPTVAIEVPDYNTYLTTFYEHNTWLAGMLANWFYDCWDKHIVYITAPTWDQAMGLTFKEVRTKRLQAGLVPTKGILFEKGFVKDPDPVARNFHYIRAINADKSEGITGEHSAPILAIIEEGVGVRHEIWEAMMSLMTQKECRILAIGNPTDESGDFGIKANSPNWKSFTISALNHPNIVWQLRTGLDLNPASNPHGEEGPVPLAVSLDWVLDMMGENNCVPIRDRSNKLEDEFWFVDMDEIARSLETHTPADLDWDHIDKFGFTGPSKNLILYKPNAFFQGRVLGIFPTASDRQVIPKSWLMGLEPQSLKDFSDMVPEIGVDTARYGSDRSVLFGRIGPCVIEGRIIRQMDSLLLADEIRKMAQRLSALSNASPFDIPIKMDITGNMGTGPYDILKAQKYNLYGVNSSHKAIKPELYPNRRSELWFNMRERIRRGGLDLSRLHTELRSELEKELGIPQYKVDLSGRKVVEDKDQMRKRMEGGASPDLADALNLAFAGFNNRSRAAGERIKSLFDN